MKRFYPVAFLFLVVCSIGPSTGCAARPPGRPAAPAHTADALGQLRLDLAGIFDDANFGNAQWGVEIVSLDNDQVLFERNSTRLYMPASNNKLLTGAAALVRLGPDFRFQTHIMTDGTVSGGVLRGNLVVVGAGDPTTASRFHGGDPFRVFRDWAGQLKQMGISNIEGKLVGDDGAFAEPSIGRAWAWDDLAYGYAAPVTALQFNENLLTLEVTPGPVPGASAGVMVLPVPDFLTVEASVTTAAAGTLPDLDLLRGEGETLRVTGTLPAGGAPVERTVAVRSPARLYLTALRRVLEEEGITVTGGTSATRNSDLSHLTLLWSHSSPPLAEILKPLFKVSQNLYAETMARTLGVAVSGTGSFAKGREVVEQVLGLMGIQRGSYTYADGSGLSRLNLISADLVVRLLKYVHRHPSFPQFYDALPVAGVDGTIADRMKGTRAANNVRAKTGTLANVRSLSGYVATADGETLVFSMIANNFLVSSASAEYVQDTALQRLATFSRRQPLPSSGSGL